MKNSLKNKLKTDYENLSEQPSENLWEKIELGLENPNEKKEIKAFPKINIWKVAAVILLLVSVGLLMNQFLNNKVQINENQMVEKENPERNLPKKVEIKSEEIRNDFIQKENIETEKIANISSENVLKENINKEKNQDKKKTEKLKISEKNNVLAKEDSSNSEPQYLANDAAKSSLNKTKTKYVSAEDLLFEREASKSLKEQENDTRKLGDLGLKIEKPKEVKILGVTVYSDENK